MAILGLGTDIVEIARIEAVIARILQPTRSASPAAILISRRSPE